MPNLFKSKQEKHLLNFHIIDSDTSFTNKLSRSLNHDPEYRIKIFYDKKEFLSQYNNDKDEYPRDQINVVIIDSDQLNQTEDYHFIDKIRKNFKNTEIIILTDEHNTEHFSDILTSGVYATIPKNDNVFYRVDNSASGIKSLKLFQRKRKIMKISLMMFLGFVVIIGILSLVFLLAT
jgi:DNA-binding NarL/FixJ family response regulator